MRYITFKISNHYSKSRLAAAEAQIGKLESGLNSVESKVAQLQEELAAHSRGAAELQLRTEATESSLTTARALLGKLDAEHSDWQTQSLTLSKRKNRIGIEAANAAALLIYQVDVASFLYIYNIIKYTAYILNKELFYRTHRRTTRSASR